MKAWLIASFLVCFIAYFVTAVRLRKMEAYGKTNYFWQSSAEKEKFDLRMNLITIYASVGIFSFITWLMFLSS